MNSFCIIFLPDSRGFPCTCSALASLIFTIAQRKTSAQETYLKSLMLLSCRGSWLLSLGHLWLCTLVQRVTTESKVAQRGVHLGVEMIHVCPFCWLLQFFPPLNVGIPRPSSFFLWYIRNHKVMFTNKQITSKEEKEYIWENITEKSEF